MKAKIALLLAAFLTLSGVGAAESYHCPPGNCESCGGFWLRVDYLYWRACLDGGAVAVNQNVVGEQFRALLIPELGPGAEEFLAADTTIDQRVKYLPDEWNSGFRLGAGYRSGESSCDYAFNWLRYTSSTSHKVAPKEEDPFVPTIFIPLAVGPALSLIEVVPVGGGMIIECDGAVAEALTSLTSDFVRGRWDLDLDFYDFEFGHSLNCGCLALRPHAAIRIVSIDQHMKVETNGKFNARVCEVTPPPISVTTKELGTYEATQKFDHEFCGVGPRVGLGAQYEVGCGWGLYGNFAAALLYGEREAKHRENADRTVNLTNGQDFTQENNFKFKQKNDRRCTSANTDVEVGLFWQTTHCWGSMDYDFELAVGWEHHYFFGQGISNVVAVADGFKEDRHDLSTQGLTVSAAIGF